ncbi:hypothetical protein Tco_1397982 [Tanacetum coccineum]
MSISAAEQDRLWKEILEEQGLPLDIPLLTADDRLEWPPKNTTPPQRHYDYVLMIRSAAVKRQTMGADVYDKMMMEQQKRLTKIFNAEDEMEDEGESRFRRRTKIVCGRDLEEQGLPLDIPLLTADDRLEWPPKNTTPPQRHYDYVLMIRSAAGKRQTMGADAYDKMMMEQQKRLTKIFNAEDEMEVRMKEMMKKKKKKKKMMKKMMKKKMMMKMMKKNMKKKKKAEEEMIMKKKAASTSVF